MNQTTNKAQHCSIHGSFIFDLVAFDVTRSRRKKAIVSRRSGSESQSID